MSLIRFLHVDHLRLGSPLTGLADCPDWLRRLVENAVRRSVTSVVETAIAHRCQFLLIAGRIAESPEDLDLAVSWLLRHQKSLAEHGIRLVVAQQTSVRSVPGSVGEALILPHGQLLLVDWSTIDAVRLTVGMRADSVTGRSAMSIEIGREISAVLRHAGLSYLAAPAACGETADVLSSTDGCLRVTAGAPQALNSSEQGAFGVRIVEADTTSRTITARFVPTDSIRFVREQVHCSEGARAEAVLSQMVERSRQISPSHGRTVIADWLIHGALTVSGMQQQASDETSLLQQLRTQLQSGHNGVWPRDVAYSSECMLRASAGVDGVIRDFLSCEAERRDSRRLTMSGSVASQLGDLPLTGAASIGIRLLSRAA